MVTEVEDFQSGDFLQDVDFEITLRSGKTDLRDLQKLIQAVKASVTSLVDTKIVLTETESKIKTSSEGKLSVVRILLRIQ